MTDITEKLPFIQWKQFTLKVCLMIESWLGRQGILSSCRRYRQLDHVQL